MPILNNFFKLNSMNSSILSLNENKFPRNNPIKIHKNAEEISKLKFDKILLINIENITIKVIIKIPNIFSLKKYKPTKSKIKN